MRRFRNLLSQCSSSSDVTFKKYFGSENLPDCSESYYVTTAINYTNGPPHIGHAYEAVLADVHARYYRLVGRDVVFCTGTDEHGLKIQNAASNEGIPTQQYCDSWAEHFKNLSEKLMVSNDIFVRTTSDNHKQQCRQFWKQCLDKGDIYLGTYKGYYCVREETYVTDAEAEKHNYFDPVSGIPYTLMEEPCYFFRLSKYQSQLINFINENPDFIQPERCRHETLVFLKSPLQDLCVSRTSFHWGIQVPGDSDHVMYVWFDALINYISAQSSNPDEQLSKSWPPNLQIIGKDIIRFHCVYWPAMLMSAGIPLPKKVFSHGFVCNSDGSKMSKSIGNCICPNQLMTEYKISVDAIRFYMSYETTCGHDLKFSCDGLIAAHNQLLGDCYGNLAQRAVVLCAKYSSGTVPSVVDSDIQYPFDVETLRSDFDRFFDKNEVRESLMTLLEACRQTNRWLTEQSPWSPSLMNTTKQLSIVRVLLEAVYVLSHFFAPFLPETAHVVFTRLQCPGRRIGSLSQCDNLTSGSEIATSWSLREGSLFPKHLNPAAEDPKIKNKPKNNNKKKKGKKEKKSEAVVAC